MNQKHALFAMPTKARRVGMKRLHGYGVLHVGIGTTFIVGQSRDEGGCVMAIEILYKKENHMRSNEPPTVREMEEMTREVCEQICWSCRWWGVRGAVYNEDEIRHTFCECRRRCPAVLYTGRSPNEFGPGSSGIDTEWPTTKGSDWCGEWEART